MWVLAAEQNPASGEFVPYLQWRTPSAAANLPDSLASLSFRSSASLSADHPDQIYALERAQFQAAVRANAKQQPELFDSLHRQLQHYPLERYLSYLKLRTRMTDSPDKESVAALNQFEKRYQDTHLTRNLTRHLQTRLVAAEDWRLFLGVSRSRLARTMPCATARATAETGGLKEWSESLSEYWIKRGSFPDLCSAAIETLEANKLPGIPQLWEKIYKSINDGRYADARSLAAKLASRDRMRVIAWVAAIDKPDKLLQGRALATDDLLNRRTVLDLTRRWSRQDPAAAVEHWWQIRENYRFEDDERYELDRELALRGAWLRRDEAYDWLSRVEVRTDDLEVMEWRIRAALYASDWSAVLTSLELLPPEELEEDHWAYWHARALQQAARAEEADVVMRKVAALPTYYGFLAADQLDLPYNIVDHHETPADPQVIAQLAQQPALIRAREYLHAGLPSQGRREWNAFTRDLPAETAQAISTAVLAERWRLPDRAIASANLAGEKKALSLRFPFAYQHLVFPAAKLTQLDPFFVYAVIRRESAYMVDIKSSAGALGLMQLMPATAQDALRFQKRSPNGSGHMSSRWVKLTDPADNISLATTYIRNIMNRFENHLALTAASYNAGPHRTLKWLPETGSVAAQQWIDTIPFSETRRYVRALLAYMIIFEWRHLESERARGVQSGKLRRVSDWLRPISANVGDSNSSDAEASAEKGN